MVLTQRGEMPAMPVGRMYHEASRKSDLPAVGDWVAARILDEDPPIAIIHAVLPRKSAFSRKQAGEKVDEQPVAVNIDTVFIVVGLDGDYNLRRVERYLTVAWESGAEPVVVLTKADTIADTGARVADVMRVAPGVPVHAVSAIEDIGLEAIESYMLPGKTLTLLGSSGVGKSTIINYLLGKDVQRVREVRETDSHGRHTTTHRQMFVLPSGTMVIDTPGMRELQLWNANDGLSNTFNDIEELARNCRFADCAHENEPGCAVQSALTDGSLDPGRFANYMKMRKELTYLELKQDVGVAQAERQRWKKIHKTIKEMYKDS
jgi:ribosome biogenesis GTPase